MSKPIVLINAAFDETKAGNVIFRGVIDPSSLDNLLVADYQREVLPISSINKLIEAMETGTVPDIEVGMRGEDFDTQEGKVLLRNETYIIDGLQRVSAARLKYSTGNGRSPYLGVTVHLNTTEEWERERFRILNTERTKLSPNVLMRNWQVSHRAVEIMYKLTSADTKSPLYRRVCWKQQMSREELISATTFAKIIGHLHSHMQGGLREKRVNQLVPALQRLFDTIGHVKFRGNTAEFFSIIDECWGIRRVTFKEGAVQLRGNFLYALAQTFSNHLDFWQGTQLVVDKSTRRKLSGFPLSDTTVTSLSSGSGKAREHLYHLIVDHLNSGRRINHLRPRQIIDNPEEEDTEEDNT